jgi:hypothetical protein
MFLVDIVVYWFVRLASYSRCYATWPYPSGHHQNLRPSNLIRPTDSAEGSAQVGLEPVTFDWDWIQDCRSTPTDFVKQSDGGAT